MLFRSRPVRGLLALLAWPWPGHVLGLLHRFPRVAHEIGAVSRQMALKAIGPALLRHCMEETKV